MLAANRDENRADGQVKPGRSYHAVEEVVVGDGRQRLGVSGW
jgi:hypothetical protein